MNLPSLRRRIGATLAAGVLLTGGVACSASAADDGSSGAGATTAVDSGAYVTTLADTHADTDDGAYDAAEATAITLADGATEVDGAGATVDGDIVTVTEPGTYVVSGTLTDGQLVVASETDGTVRLVLDGADITSTTDSALLVEQSDETVVILADGSENALSDGEASGEDDEEEDAANATLFSHDDLTIAGGGALTVTGVSADGITSKDGLVVLAGDITVTAADDGIRGKDYLVVESGEISVSAGGDALKADNDDVDEPGSILIDGGTLGIDAGDDALHAEGALTVTGGTISVTGSVEGLEAPVIDIAGGDIDVTSSDDGLNGAGDLGTIAVTIRGGTLALDAEGDGLDANGDLTISGGDITVDGPSRQGNGALDVDGTFLVSGGTLIAGDSGGMPVAPSTDSEQAWVQVSLDSAVEAGAEVVLVDDAGDEVASYEVGKTVSTVLFSSPDLADGATYTVLVGDDEVATATAGEAVAGGFGGGPGGGPGGGEPPEGGPGEAPPERG